MSVLGPTAPLPGGTDVVLPGVGVQLRGTRWAASAGTDTAGAAGTVPPTLVLLHGLSSQRRFFDPVVRRLAGLPVLTLDQRGHGDADKPDGPYDIATCTADVLTALEAAGEERVVIAGHSWGASVAVQAAATDPGRVRAVLALDGGTNPPIPAEALPAARVRLTPPRIAVPPQDVTGFYTAAPWWTGEATDAVLPGWEVGADGLARTRIGFDRHMAVLDGLLAHDATEPLFALTRTAWLVTCEPPSASAWEPSWVARREEVLRRAVEEGTDTRLLRWQGAVHDVPLQWPDLVAGLLRTAVVESMREGA